MTATALENPALRRMLRPPRPATSGARVSEARAWRSALPRVSENKISLVASVIGYDVRETDLEAILADWESYTLSLLMKGPDEARGLVQIDAELRAGLVEAQTIGRVQSAALPDRPGTPIDAALCDHVIDAWMDGAAAAGETVNGWHTARILRDTRAAKVALDDGDYTATEVSISLGEGARTGVLRILRPAVAEAAPGQRAGSGGAAGRSGLLALEAEVQAVLYRTKVPYRWLRDLRPGAILEMPRRALDHVQIETVEGKRITRARLGRQGGKRAVRILEEDAPDPPDRAPRPRPDDAFSEVEAGAPAPPARAAPVADGLPDAGPADDLPDRPDPEPMASLPDIPGLPPLAD